MSLLTPLRRHTTTPLETTPKEVTIPAHPDFSKVGEVSVYVTNTRAGEVASKFVKLYGRKFLEQSNIVSPEQQDTVLQQTAEMLPDLGWKAAVAAEYKSPMSGYQDTGEISLVSQKSIKQPIYETEPVSVHDERVKGHKHDNLVSGSAATLVMGAMALGLEMQNQQGTPLNRYDLAHARDMLAAGQPEPENPTHFHYDLV